ncbi:MAG: cell division protein PerM [Marmoricola sp.]
MSSTTRTRPAPRSPAAQPAPRPLVVAGAIAGATSVGVGLLLCMAVALIGWFLADAGAHGETTDALRVGADAWLLGIGSDLHVAGIPVAVSPLGLTGLLLVVAFRTGRWAARDVVDDGSLGVAVGMVALVHLVLAVVVALLATEGGAAASLPRAILGAACLGAVAGGLGLAAGTGRLRRTWQAVPGHVRAVLVGAVAAVAAVLACAAVLVAAALLVSFNDAATQFSALGFATGDAVMLVVVTALLAPNAVLFGAAWLTGPGFALGVGTTVTATSVTLGPLPVFPLLAALPGQGSQPGWSVALFAVPPVCAAVAAGVAQHRYAVTAWDSAGLRAFAVGALGAVVLVVLAAASGGSLGTGRLTDIGVPVGALLVTAVGGMSTGALLGGLAVTAWQRRRVA